MTSILFLHGGALNREMWAQQVEDLSESFDIHTIDLPGHGGNFEERFTFDSSVQEIYRYVESNIKGQVVLVGSSLGGYVAISFAYHYPQLVSKLVLSGCSVQYIGLLGIIAKCNVFFLKRIRGEQFQSMQRKQLTKIASPNIVEHITRSGISLSGARDSMRDIIGRDFSHLISKIKVPVLIANGESDKLNNKYKHQYMKVCADISEHIIDNCGHLCSLEKPEEFSSAVIKFVLNTENA